MKKTYQNPTTKVVMIKPIQMIAKSVGVGDTYSGTEVLSREADDFWDEEE